MSQHTPGPWRYENNEVVTPDGERLLLTGVSLTTGHTPGPLCSEVRANARLIAAAPDLLETAIQILAKWDDFMNDDGSVNPLDYMDSAHFAPLREAVAKATGQGGAA